MPSAEEDDPSGRHRSVESSNSGPDPAKDSEFREKLDLTEKMETPLMEVVEEEVVEGDLESFIPTPPDGGWGWVIVVASFMSNLVVDGIAYSFGVFLPEFSRYYGVSQGVTAIVGSLLTGTYLLVGPIVSGLVNQWGSKVVMMSGAVVGCGAFLLSVYSPSITLLMLSYGVLGGIGFGLIYLPAIVHVGIYFEKRRALATGIAVAGSGAGTFIFAPLSVALIDYFGWKGAIWIMAGFVLNCAVFGSVLRELKPERDPGTLQTQIEDQREHLRSTLSNMNLESGLSALSLNSLRQFRDRTLSASSTKGKPIRATTTPSENQPRQRDRSIVSESGSTETGAELRSNAVGPQLRVLKEDEEATAEDPLIDPTRTSSFSTPGRRLTNRKRSSNSTTSNSNPPSAKVSNAVSTVSSSVVPSSQGAHPAQIGPRQRRSHRISARSYASSISRLPTLPTQMAANSLSTLGSLQSGDFGKPLYRQDIFYSGSVVHLPQYRASQADISKYRQSTISIPQGLQHCEEVELNGVPALVTLDDEFDDHPGRGLCFWLPRSVQNVLFEMMGLSLLKDPVMALLCLSNIFGMLGFYCPFVFISDKAIVETGVSKQEAAFLLSIIGITNTLGRVVFGWISDQRWVSALFINNVCLGVCAGLTLLLPLFNSYGALVTYCALFGFMVSAYISLTSIILVEYVGLEHLSNSFGLLILSRGIAAMVGSPLAGLVYDATGSYNASFIYSGAMLAAACLVSCGVHLIPPVDLPCLRKADDEYEDDDEGEETV